MQPLDSPQAAISSAAAYSSVAGAPVVGARMSNRIMNTNGSPHSSAFSRRACQTPR